VTLAISVKGLVELAWVAPLAVLVVAGSFACALLGTTRATELRRAGDAGRATAYGLLGFAGAAVFAAAVVAGVGIIVAG
jgi:hypothetical protein